MSLARRLLEADSYKGHLTLCTRCSARPFDLCTEGASILARENAQRDDESGPQLRGGLRPHAEGAVHLRKGIPPPK